MCVVCVLGLCVNGFGVGDYVFVYIYISCAHYRISALSLSTWSESVFWCHPKIVHSYHSYIFASILFLFGLCLDWVLPFFAISSVLIRVFLWMMRGWVWKIYQLVCVSMWFVFKVGGLWPELYRVFWRRLMVTARFGWLDVCFSLYMYWVVYIYILYMFVHIYTLCADGETHPTT